MTPNALAPDQSEESGQGGPRRGAALLAASPLDKLGEPPNQQRVPTIAVQGHLQTLAGAFPLVI